ncbi:MAG: protein-L-isoaspartate(D-aspartate) O-methyltransferase [Candidatus Latescibacterota bacterium]|nr:MAG: protein-L-isoaspartate(D-aspartate) O-methyltransferase [Candidatus Latescibacterota bacterium]
MVKEQLISNGISDPRVLEVMLRTPRHLFIDDELGPQAYSDHAFPIGYSQTMSQPYMVAYLCEQLALKGNEKVLEIGTGSGYQAAVLAGLAKSVYTIERIEELAEKAKAVLRDLEISNVEISVGDGSEGWREFEPFDRILITAAAAEVPQSLLMQLCDGGFFLGPVFRNAGEQEIVRLIRSGEKFRLERLRQCSFVPLVRDPLDDGQNTTTENPSVR